MWARIMRDRFGANEPRSMMCRFHVQTAGSSLTAQSIDNNVVRTTVQALAAVLGGAQSLHTNARDEALALPTAEAARLALRTQQIIAYESGVTETPDPLAGSWYVETLTNELECGRQRPTGRDRGDRRHARRDRGGIPAAPDPGGGLPGQRAIEAGEQVVVGLNRFVDDGPASGRRSSDRSRGRAPPGRALERCEPNATQRPGRRRSMRLEAAAQGAENLMPT